MTTNLARAGWVFIAIIFLLLGGFSAKKLSAAFIQKPIVLETLQLLPQPKPLPAVLLRTASGDAFSREKFEQHWNLIFFGFTSCPDFCPLELQKLGRLLALAQQEEKSVQVIFVSVDPERDTSERLAQYVSFFHPHIIGLRGDNPAIASLARFLGATYERSAIINERAINIPAGAAMPGLAGEQYQVNHSTRVFVIDPQGQYVGSVAKAGTPEALWADLRQLF